MFWFQTVHPRTGARLEVEALHFPPRRGRRDEFGAPQEPDEPEAVRVSSATDEMGYLVEIQEIMPDLERAAWRFLDRQV